MNRYQRRLYREQSKKAAGGYVPPADCIGKEFTFSAFIYRVVQYHPRKGKFTCELVNALDRRVQVEEIFVRHHCTPPTPWDPNEFPVRAATPRYLPDTDPIMSDKTEPGAPVAVSQAECPVGDKMLDTELATVQLNTTLELSPEVDTCSDVHLETTSARMDVNKVPVAEFPMPVVAFNPNLVTGDIKNQGEWHRCLVIARDLKIKQLWGGVLPLHICGDVTAIHYQLTIHKQLPRMTLVGSQWQVSAATPIAVTPVDTAPVAVAETPNPDCYIGQEFEWQFQDSRFTFRVQQYNAKRNAFLLYTVGGCTGSFYRDAAFVYEHCQPAAAPVVREPLPVIKFDPRRFWNLVSLADKRQYIAAQVRVTGEPMADPLRTCGCCGQHLWIIGIQTYPAKYKLQDVTLVECRNENCIVYRRTAAAESHHETCELARCEALKQEQVAYASDRSQHWLAESKRLYESGKGHTKPALAAERKARYWRDQLNKLGVDTEGLRS